MPAGKKSPNFVQSERDDIDLDRDDQQYINVEENYESQGLVKQDSFGDLVRS